MKRLSNKAIAILIGISIASFGITGAAHFTNLFQLRQVQVNGEVLETWQEVHSVLNNRTILRQPLDSLAAEMIADPEIFRVSLSLALPHQLDIVTNSFVPVSLLLDREGGFMAGLNSEGRVVPLTDNTDLSELPVISGVKIGNKFIRSRMSRVNEALNQILIIRNDNIDLYRMIDEIDLSNNSYSIVYLAGLSYRLKTGIATMAFDLQRFVEFLTRYEPYLDETGEIDLRFGNMIVCNEKGRRRGR